MKLFDVLLAAALVQACASTQDAGCDQLSDCPSDRACIRSVPDGVCAGTDCGPGEILVRTPWPRVPTAMCLVRCGGGGCRDGWVCSSIDGNSACVPRCDRMPAEFCGGYRCLSDGRCNALCIDDGDCDATSRCSAQECVPR